MKQAHLQNYQSKNKPEYIQKQARIRLEKEGKLQAEEPEIKRRRPDSVEPLERPVTASPPDLPEDLRMLQVYCKTRNVHAY